jgi:hypothetical protein
VILLLLADEAYHRDFTHTFSDDLAGHAEGGAVAVCPEHAVESLGLS